jgi:hypothetical protein
VWLGVGLIAVLVVTSSTFGVGGALQDVSFGAMKATAAPAGNQTVHGGFGDLRVDASSFRGPGTLTVESVVGRTIVTFGSSAPPADLQVDARLLAGQICVDGRRVASRVGASYQGPYSQGPTPSGTPAGTGETVLKVHQVFGLIQIGQQGCAP